MTISVPAWSLLAHALVPMAATLLESAWEGQKVPFDTDQAIRLIFYSFAAGAAIGLGIGALTPVFHSYCSLIPLRAREIVIVVSYLGASTLGLILFFKGKENPISELYD